MKRKQLISLTLVLVLILTSCQKKQTEETMEQPAEQLTEQLTNEPTEQPEETKDEVEETMREDTKPTEKAEQEEAEQEETEQEEIEVEEDAPACISDEIPSKYFTKRTDHAGTIEHISYSTYDYFGDGTEITKSAYVYLPYEYDESKQYNVLYLMHGIGGNEKEWGMYNDTSRVKAMMDNLIYYGDIEPFLIVTPNGRSSVDFANTNSDYNSFYLFGQELRNDLIPYIERTYSTYTSSKADGLGATRDHRAMAGLSMGGMQTINIGMCECLDLISWFGAFSAAPTSNSASVIANCLKDFPEEKIHYFYNICGKEDNIAWQSAVTATKNLTSLTEKLTDEENFMWQEVTGVHDFNVWYLGFYNFAQLVFEDETSQENQ